jgi:HD-like signal output (HDOD) protein
MELVVCQRSVDLAQVSQLVLSDLGATLQILRQASGENAMGGGRLERVEDCISGLGLEGCIEAMSMCPITRSARFAPVYSAWNRARDIATISRFVAEKLALNVASEDAYLVGLAHGIGNLPEILDWDWISQFGGNSDLAGLRIAEAWRLPHCIVEYFLDRMAGKEQSQWITIVDRALELSESRPAASLRDELISLPFAPSERYQPVAS